MKPIINDRFTPSKTQNTGFMGLISMSAPFFGGLSALMVPRETGHASGRQSIDAGGCKRESLSTTHSWEQRDNYTMNKDMDDLADLCDQMSALFSGGADLDDIENTLAQIEATAEELGIDLTPPTTTLEA